jgi:hypothetical protein
VGAELVITWCDLPPLAILDDPDQALVALPDDALAAVHREWQAEEPPDDAEGGDEGDGDWREGTRDRLREALGNLLGARDCTVLDIHGHEVVIGGGTSWGDAPEGYLDVVLVAISGIGQLAE